MCGIMGYIGRADHAGAIALRGLQRQEYRGYDSWGMVVLGTGGIVKEKHVGRITEEHLDGPVASAAGSIAIGHTRWATHGAVTEENCHPHFSCDGRIAVVHNGIIENYDTLRSHLESLGHRFRSETDSEVIPHLIEENLKSDGLLESVSAALRKLKGTFALIVAAEGNDELIVARHGSPLIIGLGEGETFIASDLAGFLDHTSSALFLDDREMALVGEEVRVLNYLTGQPGKKEVREIQWSAGAASKGDHDHFMHKEIHEQPDAIARTLESEDQLEGITSEDIDRIILVACGSACYAGMVGRYMFEQFARIPVEVDHASEFRYRDPIIGERHLVIAITQSGETIDTLEAVREAKRKGARTLGICNVRDSAIARESEQVFYTQAGPEIGVASTKAFNCQLVAQFMIALHFGRERGTLDDGEAAELHGELAKVPGLVDAVLVDEPVIVDLAKTYCHQSNFLYAGRGVNFGIAMEGALKLKETSYIHAEGMSAAELKHGAIALIDHDMPSVFVAVRDGTYQKVINNMQEVKSRGGRIITIANDRDEKIGSVSDHVFFVPDGIEHLLPCLTVVPLQLLAYHIARLRGCDVDKPRNLAKCVTVE
ncbi:MAG: glutamine--fructose-6-phosphate transaminase (isomerizing) [Planctomycetes bacterium]|nr:glutamine--fructose-6-phosphate transaminase (isomerizing) [Planctomycetota bacterium]